MLRHAQVLERAVLCGWVGDHNEESKGGRQTVGLKYCQQQEMGRNGCACTEAIRVESDLRGNSCITTQVYIFVHMCIYLNI